MDPRVSNESATLPRAEAFGPAAAALERLVNTVGGDTSPALAAESIRQAMREFPGSWEETWESRFRRAGEDLGVRMTSLPMTPREALAHTHTDSPALTLADDGQTWIVLTGRSGNTVRVYDGERERWVNAAGLARAIGSSDPNQPHTWQLAQSVAPCLPGEHGPGHGVGHVRGDGPGHTDHHHPPSYWLFRILRPEWSDVGLIILFACAIGLFNLAIPVTVEELINTISRGVVIQPLIIIAAVLFVCLSLSAAFRGMQVLLVEYLQQRLFVRIASDLAWRLPRVQQQVFDQQHGPELVNRFFDTLNLQKAVAILLLDGVTVVITTFIGLTILGFYHPFLLGFDIVLLSLIAFIIFGLGQRAITTNIRESVAKYKVLYWLQELVHHPRAFKQAGGSEMAWSKADRLTRDYLHARRAHFRILYRQIVFSLGLQVVASTALLGLGGYLVMIRELNFGQLVAAELIVTLIVTGFTKLGKSLETFYHMMTSVDKLGLLLGLPLERHGGEFLPPSETGIELKLTELGYTYPGTGRKILEGIKLELKPGEKVGLIGGSGTGKSTLVELLAGLREPTQGRIEIDGISIRDLRFETLRDQVFIVQDIEIFDGTVMDNVRMGRDHISAADVRKALSDVGLLDDIQAMRDSLQSYLVTGGPSLSFGQAERLMLARAIVGRPRLLILDEALDNLDTQARWRMMPILFDPKAPWTLIIITRRGEVLDQCDRVLEIHKSSPSGPATIGPARRMGRMIGGGAPTEAN